MTGIAIAFFGNQPGAAVTVSSITPASQSPIGPQTSRTFSACSLTVTGGTPSSITWSFVGASDGTFTVNSGQGTLSATPRVTGVISGTTATATFRCTLVVNGETFVRDCSLSYNNQNTA